MGRYSKKVNSRWNVLTTVSVVLGVVLVLLIVLLVCLGSGKKPEVAVPDSTESIVTAPAQTTPTEETLPKMKELLVESVEEQEDIVLVNTTYVTVNYPYAFSDIVSVEAQTFEDSAVLEFGAIIHDTTHKTYALFFNGEEGMPVGTLLLDGETYVVTAQFYDVSGISEDSMITFYAAQETFNDVVNSLSENEGFTAAE